MERLNAKGQLPADKDSTTVEQWLDVWLTKEVKPNLAPKTFTYYEMMCRLYIVPVLGRTPILRLNRAQIQNLISEMKFKGSSPSTIRGAKITLSRALKSAVQNNLIAFNPAIDIMLPKLEPNEPKHLETEQVNQLLSSIEGNWYAPLFTVAIHAGLRNGEIRGLTWKDIDFKSECIQVRHQLQRIDGRLTHKSLKSKAARREIPLTKQALEALITQRAWIDLGGWKNPMDLVFLNDLGRPLDEKYINDLLKKCLNDIGLEKMRFHDLRHTTATLMLANGISIHDVQKIIGHSQISLTTDLYGHGTREAHRRAMTKFSESFVDVD
ncbi:MAG: site-specific integrase [Armatimonadetes bacterium]|nr:site-specific integrase [Armatimonadota bacterium]